MRIAVFSASGEAAGWASETEVVAQLLYHHQISALLVDGDSNVLVARDSRKDPTHYDTFYTSVAQTHVEDFSAHISSMPPELSAAVQFHEAIIPATWDTKFRKVSIAYLRHPTIGSIPANFELLAPATLAQQLEDHEATASYTLLLGLIEAPELDRLMRSRFALVSERMLQSQEWVESLPRYHVDSASASSFDRLYREASCALQGSPQIAKELLAIYDNQRPYYPAPDGLEVGDVVLGTEEIQQGIRQMAKDLQSKFGSNLDLIGKLESGRKVAENLSISLNALNVPHALNMVKTRWMGHGIAMTEEPVSASGQNRNLVICDTMISSGSTFSAIASEVADVEGRSVVSATLINFDRRRHFYP